MSMKKFNKIICCDLDDTLADTEKIVMCKAMEYNQKKLKKTNSPNYNILCEDYYYFADALEWTDCECKAFFRQYFPRIYGSIEPISKNIEVLHQFNNSGYEIHVVSSRPDTKKVYQITESWLKKYSIPYHKLIINTRDKAKYISKVKAIAFIDDSYKNCMNVAQNTNASVFLVNRWYNLRLEVPSFVERIDSFQKLYDFLKEDEVNDLSNSFK